MRSRFTFSVPFENPGLRDDSGQCIWYVGVGRSTATAKLAAYLSREALLPSTCPAKAATDHPAGVLVIAGFAGALNPQVRAGDAFLCENMCDPEMIQSLLARGWRPPPSATLHTSERIVETSAQKAHLHQMTGCDLVDMETQFLLEVARFHSIPVLTIRAVSDDAAMDLPVPEPILYDKRRQRARPLALCGYLATNPDRIPGFMSMMKGSFRARNQLGLHLRGLRPFLSSSVSFLEQI